MPVVGGPGGRPIGGGIIDGGGGAIIGDYRIADDDGHCGNSAFWAMRPRKRFWCVKFVKFRSSASISPKRLVFASGVSLSVSTAVKSAPCASSTLTVSDAVVECGPVERQPLVLITASEIGAFLEQDDDLGRIALFRSLSEAFLVAGCRRCLAESISGCDLNCTVDSVGGV
jgi:hypothetical protein